MTRGSRPGLGTAAGAGALGRGGDRTARSLSVLDLSPVREGSSPAAALHAQEREVIRRGRAGTSSEAPDTVRRKLAELADRTDADELMVTTMTHGPAARLLSYRLVAEATA